MRGRRAVSSLKRSVIERTRSFPELRCMVGAMTIDDEVLEERDYRLAKRQHLLLMRRDNLVAQAQTEGTVSHFLRAIQMEMNMLIEARHEIKKMQIYKSKR